MEFQHITGTENAQYAHITRDEQIAAGFQRSPYHEGAYHCGTVVFRPLVFNPNQHPLPAVEFEMLQTGELEKALFRIDQPSRMQATPAGRAASSTVMV